MHREQDYKEEIVDILYRNSKNFWFYHRNKIILTVIATYYRKPKQNIRILELGSGAGNISRFLKSKGYRIDTSDMYESALTYLRDTVDSTFVFDLISDEVPLTHKYKYDIVILGDVIEHFDEPVKVLKKTKAFLVETGSIILTVPALMQLFTPYDKYCGHKKRYYRSDLRTALVDSDYYVKELKYFMFLPAIILFIKRRIKMIINKRADFFKNEITVPDIVNIFMGSLMNIEFIIGKFLKLPFGSSLISIAENK
jgi:2-polyprenyl-3-methyl-5-hydroxy-6-metoxy-1,4-benzoquinol methylase